MTADDRRPTTDVAETGGRGDAGNPSAVSRQPSDSQRPDDPPPAPIADLSYRTYNGPLMTRTARWWIIARSTAQLALKKRGFWFVVLLAALPYVFYGLMLYVQSRSPLGRLPEPLQLTAPGQLYSGTIYLAYNGQQFLLLFIVAMMVGPSVIAADNQANALQVYLSKPITKADYLLGKWMGIFLVVFAVGAAPAILLYLYCLISYIGEGFIRESPLLIVRLLAACAIPGIVHASLLVGISAWSKTPRMAGAIYAGFYFVSFAISQTVWGITTEGTMSEGILERHLSVTGVISGLAQNVFGVYLKNLDLRREGPQMITLPAPPLGAMLALAFVLCFAGILAARMRIRAVEVVRG